MDKNQGSKATIGYDCSLTRLRDKVFCNMSSEDSRRPRFDAPGTDVGPCTPPESETRHVR